jgi:hypothetical protein
MRKSFRWSCQDVAKALNCRYGTPSDVGELPRGLSRFWAPELKRFRWIATAFTSVYGLDGHTSSQDKNAQQPEKIGQPIAVGHGGEADGLVTAVILARAGNVAMKAAQNFTSSFS